MKILKALIPFFILSTSVFASESIHTSYLTPQVPFGGCNENSIHIVWTSIKNISPETADYYVYVNGQKLDESAAAQSQKTNDYNAAFKKSFYEYFNEERTGMKMIQTDTTFYKLENLKSSEKYRIRIAACDKDGKELFSSSEVTVKTTEKTSKVLNILDFGAATDSSNNTKAIQKAIDACPKNGTVLIPEGTFVSGSIHLKSNMTLRIDGTLTGSPDAADYDFGFLMYKYYTDRRYFGLINADGAKNIRICGKGTVDGNGWKYTSAVTTQPLVLPSYSKGNKSTVREKGILAASCVKKSGFRDESEAYATRSTTVILRNIKGLFIEGLTFKNPANHMINILDSKDISVTGIKIFSYDVNNGDGIGLICTENGFVWNNFIDTGDDSIVFSAGVGAPAADSGESEAGNFRIFGNYIHHGHGGVAFGSHTALGIHDVIVEDNIFSHTDAPFRFKSAPANGGEVYNIWFKNNALAENIQAFTMSTDYNDKGTVSKYGAADKVAVFHHIHVENITSFGTKNNTIFITAKDGDFHHNLHFKNIRFAQAGRNKTPGKGSGFAWFVLKNVKDSSFKNIKVLSWDKSSEEDSRVMWGLKEGLENVIFE